MKCQRMHVVHRPAWMISVGVAGWLVAVTVDLAKPCT